MNSLRIVKNAEGVKGKVLSNQCVLIKEETAELYNGYNVLKYYMYNLDKNIKTEVAPTVAKHNIIEIIDINTHSKYIYFSNFNTDGNNIEIRIHRYSIEEKTCKCIHTITDEMCKYDRFMRTKIFVLNEFYMLIQNEFLRSNFTDSYEDYLDFELFMFNILQNETIKVIDENLCANGIDDIKLISENICVLKSGFSLIKDERYKKLEKEEMSVESVSFVNLGQLVSDIIISKSNIVMNTIEQTFFNSTIPYIDVVDDYLIYSKYDFVHNTENVVFYNYSTKDSRMCINKNDNVEEIVLGKPIIFNKKPYMIVETSNGVEFYNIIEKEVDFIFKGEGKFECAINDMIISSTQKKGFFGKKNILNMYKYPGPTLVHMEKGIFSGYINDGCGNTYILIV